MPKHIRSQQRTTTTLVLVYVLLVAAIAGVTAYVSAGHSVKNAVTLASTHQPETFTELYFLSPSKLPVFAAPGKPQIVHFRIQNDTEQSTAYTYRITASGTHGTSTTSKTVTVRAGQGVTVPYSFTIPKPNEQLTVTVNLVGTQDHLSFRSES